MSIDYVERARALVGTRFRPQGRSETELDCVGLVLVTFGIATDDVRRDYPLRGDHWLEINKELNRFFRKVLNSGVRPGDVMLLEVASDQLHLAIRSDVGFVHAHARIGRVVETPGSPEWPLIAVYRKRRSR